MSSARIHGNILGKCVVLAIYEGPILLVTSKKDIEILLNFEFNVRSADDELTSVAKLVLFLLVVEGSSPSNSYTRLYPVL